jgi:prepilin-type processing-associated H-X9-DG protein
MVCGANLNGITKALYVYANEDEQNRLPPGDKWCDLLVGRDYAEPKQFVCKSSGAVEGESSYAINKYLAGKPLDRVPGDIVLVFETDFGLDPNGRSEPAGNRMCYKMRNEPGPNKTVYKYRWNLAGGAEILSTRNHDGKGCNVGFVDAHVEWVEAADLPKLKFKPDPNEFDRAYESYSLTNQAGGYRTD